MRWLDLLERLRAARPPARASSPATARRSPRAARPAPSAPPCARRAAPRRTRTAARAARSRWPCARSPSASACGAAPARPAARTLLMRHAPDVALLRGQPDRPRVGRIVLVAAHERPHLARRQQLDLVAQRAQHARPVVRAAASLHHDPHRHAAARSTRPAWHAPASCGRSRPSRHQPSAVASRSLQCPSHKSYDPFGASVREVDTRNSTLALDAVRREAPPQLDVVGAPFPLAGRAGGWVVCVQLQFRSRRWLWVGGVHSFASCADTRTTRRRLVL